MSFFGERVKELHKARGLTQKQMADALSITERNYQRYETTNSPSNDTLLKLANFFDVSTDFLLGLNDAAFFVPNFIFYSKSFRELSHEAKLVYMIMLNEYGDSDVAISGKLDSEGLAVSQEVFIDEVKEMFDLSDTDFDRFAKELFDFGLLKKPK